MPLTAVSGLYSTAQDFFISSMAKRIGYPRKFFFTKVEFYKQLVAGPIKPDPIKIQSKFWP